MEGCLAGPVVSAANFKGCPNKKLKRLEKTLLNKE